MTLRDHVAGPAPGVPRAPRLRPDQRIAAHITRVGRFRAIDPSKPTRPPAFWALVGRAGWAVLVGESLRRARKRVRGAPDALAGSGDDGTGLIPFERTSG